MSESSEPDEYLVEAIGFYGEARGLTNDCELMAATYYAEGDCYAELGKYWLAIQSYQNVVESWPNYKNACICYLRIATCYEKLMESGEVSRAQAREQIQRSCCAVIDKYPECSMSIEANKMLMRWNN